MRSPALTRLRTLSGSPINSSKRLRSLIIAWRMSSVLASPRARRNATSCAAR